MKNKSIKYTISLFTVLLLVLIITAEFHHNHPTLISVHETCTVAVFQSVIASGLIYLLVIVLIHGEHKPFLFDNSPRTTKYIPRSVLSDRAPPQ
jgi:hypothetical protein